MRLGSGKVGAGSPGEGSGKEGGGKATKVTLSWCDESGDHSVELPALHSPSLRLSRVDPFRRAAPRGRCCTQTLGSATR